MPDTEAVAYPFTVVNGVVLVNKRAMTAQQRAALKADLKIRRLAWIAANPEDCTAEFDGVCRCR